MSREDEPLSAVRAQSEACVQMAHRILKSIDGDPHLPIGYELAAALTYCGVLMLRDLDTPAGALHEWVDRLYQSDARIIDPDPVGEA